MNHSRSTSLKSQTNRAANPQPGRDVSNRQKRIVHHHPMRATTFPYLPNRHPTINHPPPTRAINGA